MEYLSLRDCDRFFDHFRTGLLTTGLLAPLCTYHSESAMLASAIGSWHRALADGKSFPESFRFMSPRFPRCIEELFAAAAERASLDTAISDLLRLYPSTSSEEELINAVARLLDRYRGTTNAGVVCDGCFDRDFMKILRRAALEGADEVHLWQEGEEFFHQMYLAVKPIHVIEPCHSMVLNTIRNKLDAATDGGVIHLTTERERLWVKQETSERYSITLGQQVLTMGFRAPAT